MNAVVWRTLKRHRTAFIILVILTMISAGLITGNAYLEGKLLDSLVYSRDPRLFVLFFGLMLSFGILRLVISFFTSHIQILTKQKTVLELNRNIIFRLVYKFVTELVDRCVLKRVRQPRNLHVRASGTMA
ncbi:hypothetical protein ACPD8N_02240 [Lacticaseibacillus chiayiensis]|uniref:ABC transmembrane type-1 domain-containing protein n=1 Tax=Lacticaseibacillus chiayiensis TaxID=2100821 RepID=A0ABY6H828_9LACO|nr:hypothetical protein [Lacticaseibacillus chiayiensis]UYN56619.1 hypothetical protein OFW50_00485 [Lacticaseibacillus chiayiensis]